MPLAARCGHVSMLEANEMYGEEKRTPSASLDENQLACPGPLLFLLPTTGTALAASLLIVHRS